MNEAVLPIDRRAFEDALRFGLTPQLGRADLENERDRWHERRLGALIGSTLWGQPGSSRKKFHETS